MDMTSSQNWRTITNKVLERKEASLGYWTEWIAALTDGPWCMSIEMKLYGCGIDLDPRNQQF